MLFKISFETEQIFEFCQPQYQQYTHKFLKKTYSTIMLIVKITSRLVNN